MDSAASGAEVVSPPEAKKDDEGAAPRGEDKSSGAEEEGSTSIGSVPAPLETYFANPASSRTKTREPSSGEPEEVVEFGEGPLGLTMRRTREEVVVVHSIAADTQASTKGLSGGDRILQLGAFDLRGRRIDKEVWKRAIEHVKNCPRPLVVVFRRSAPKRRAKLPDALEAATAFAAQRTVAAKRKLVWRSKEPSRGRAIVDASDARLIFDGPVAIWRQPQRFRAMLANLVAHGDRFQRDRYALVFKRTSTNAVVLVVAVLATPQLAAFANRWRLPDTSLDVEKCAPLDACKLRRQPSVVAVEEGVSAFEIAAPDGDLTLAVDSEAAKTAWLSLLATALLNSVRTDSAADLAEDDAWRLDVLMATPLSLAATATSDESSRFEDDLVVALKGSGVDLRDARGRTALHWAATRGDSGAVAALLDAGADRDAADAAGSTPLHEAARSWHDASVSLLLSAAASSRRAASDDSFEEADPQTRYGDGDVALEVRDEGGATPVLATAQASHGASPKDLERLSRTILALSAWGAQLDARDGSGLCLVHRLAWARKADEINVVCRSCGVDATTRLLASPRHEDAAAAANLLHRGANALHVAFAGQVAAIPGDDDTSSLSRTCDVLIKCGCSAYDVDAQGRVALELPFVALEQVGEYSPALRAAICALCVADLDPSSETPSKSKPLVELALAAAKQRGQRKSQQSPSWTTLVEALEAIKKDRKRKNNKGGGGLGSWFTSLAATSPDDETRTEEASSTTTGEFQPPSRGPVGDSSRDGQPPLPRNFASRAYQRSANDEAYREELFGTMAPASLEASASRKIEGHAAGFEDLQNELAQRGERLGKLSEKSEELANAAAEFEKMCTRLNQQQHAHPGWW